MYILKDVYKLHFSLLVIRLIVSVAWIAHIVIYLLIDPPLSPFLNEVFIKLDDVWGKAMDCCCLYYFASFHYDLFLRCVLYFIRSSGNCCICFLLLLSSACSDCRGNDAWNEISFHYNPSHEVMKIMG